MPNSSAGLVNKTFAVYVKDLRLELRTRYALNAILMFGITTLTVVSFAVGQSALQENLMAALFWVIMFFSAMSGLSQGFVREEETGTSLALKLAADPTAVYLGKLAFNFTLLAIITIIITPLFFVFTDAPNDNLLPFFIVLLLGVIGLCGATTLIAAIISKAAVKGALFAVLSFPLLLTLLMGLNSATERVFEGSSIMEISTDLQFLVAYAVIMITGSIMLFKFVWQE